MERWHRRISPFFHESGDHNTGGLSLGSEKYKS